MKRNALLTFLLIYSVGFVFATHYRGGDITYHFIGTYTIEASVITYTKISGVSIGADRDTVDIDWGDGTEQVIPRVNGPIGPSGYPNGVLVATDVKENIYTGVHEYQGPPSPTNYYIISFFDNNRLDGIANINGGNSVEIPLFFADTVYMGAGMNVIMKDSDRSPIFLNSSIYYTNIEDTFAYNSPTYDPDGDSLSYQLIPPLQGLGSPVPGFILPGGFCQQSGLGLGLNNIFQLDQNTGQITWATPCEQGFFQYAILVNKYRCGTFIGNVERDMQIIAIEVEDHPPVLSATPDTTIQPGQMIQYNISSFDSDLFPIDSIQILGEAFQASHNAPLFQSIAGHPATATFTWQPDNSFIRPYPYLFTVIATDNYTAYGPDGNIDLFPMSDTKAFRVWVKDSATIPCFIAGIDKVADNLELNLYPNPANDVVHLQSLSPVSMLIVTDVSGRQVLSQKTNCTSCDLQVNGLANGVYFLNIVINDLAVTRNFIKIE